MNDVLLAPLVALCTAALLMLVTALAARRLNRVAVVDVAWGLGFVLVALASTVVGLTTDGDPVRRWIVLALVSTWGLRLAWHIRRRAVGHGEDPRYETLLGGPLREVGLPVAIRKVFLVQGVALWLVSLPVQVGAALPVRWWPLVAAGALLFAIASFAILRRGTEAGGLA